MTTNTTTALLPAAVARMQPRRDTEASFADVLADVRLSDYWPLLADTLTCAVGAIRAAHAGECRRRDCATCAAIADAATWVQAHTELNDTACGCNPGCAHRHHIPHPTRGFQP